MAKGIGNRTIDNIISSMNPNLKRQQAGMQQFIQQMAQRQGTAGAYRRSAEAVAPYAEEASKKAGDLALSATRLDEQKAQFETQQEAWERQFAESQSQNKMTNLLNQYNATGVWTKEMLDAFGFDPSRSGQRNLGRDLSELGLTQGSGGGPGQPNTGASSGSFGQNNEMLYKRAFQPLSQFSTKSQRNQQAWLQSQFG